MSRILIADDSSFLRYTLSNILKNEGHEVDLAINGREALEKIHADPPDCLFLGMLMPEGNGDQVLESLQSRGVTLPIIVLTADIQESRKVRCFELGATAFVNKPVNQAQVRKVLQEVFPTPQHSEAPCT